MWDKIKFTLYELGWLEPITMKNKIHYLIYLGLGKINKDNIHIHSLEKDIVIYAHTLDKLIQQNFMINRVTVKPITQDSVVDMQMKYWLTNNKHLLDNTEEVYKEWLLLALKIHMVYQLCKPMVSNLTAQGNSRLIQPYIINIESIVKVLLENKNT